MGNCDFQRHRELEQADGPFCSFRPLQFNRGRGGLEKRSWKGMCLSILQNGPICVQMEVL